MWITAERLYLRTLELAKARQILIPDEHKAQALERVERTLSGISQAIEAALPRNLRRKEECYFCFEKDDAGDVYGSWRHALKKQRFKMKSEIKYQATVLGELPEEVADLLAETMIDEIFESEMTLPGFSRMDQSTRQNVWLRLRPRTTNRFA
ncbi:MAG TPA: hypothetical protein VFS76_16175 [Pyrinomonadaceae bacterium]|nr:hypothetical protein [Pyrinomonadaceae bacterium]